MTDIYLWDAKRVLCESDICIERFSFVGNNGKGELNEPPKIKRLWYGGTSKKILVESLDKIPFGILDDPNIPQQKLQPRRQEFLTGGANRAKRGNLREATEPERSEGTYSWGVWGR